MDVVITTDRRPTPEMIEDARRLAEKLKAPYVKRRHRTIESIKKEFGKNVLVVGRELNLTLYTISGKKLFFHPGLLKIRLLNYLSTGHEAMIDAMELKEGDKVLDCNLGLAQDALLAAFVSKREVVGVEKDPVIFEIVSRGLKSYRPKGKLKVAEFAFKLVKPVLGDNYEFLKKQPDKSFDIVYFSPMFVKPKWHCDVMAPFREVAVKDFVTPETLKEAERVARKRVVIKVNKGVKELFPFLSDYELRPSSTNVEYLVKIL
ncbi:MAG: class I SAM-dependent methyltransferase [Desulfurobacteriaceae bacterium]